MALQTFSFKIDDALDPDVVAMDSHVVLKIETPPGIFNVLHVEMAAATEIVFDVTFASDYTEVVSDICRVAPRMMRLDSDLMEAYDDAFWTQPRLGDRIAVRDFLTKYAGRITPDNLQEVFFE